MSSKRPYKSQRKNSSARPYTQPPTFLFSVTDLPLNPEFPERHEPESGLWMPPLECDGFRPRPPTTPYLYRWDNNGGVTWAQNYVWANWQWRNSTTTVPTNLEIYRATSTFWCNPMYMTSTCDPSIYNMKDEDVPHNRWWPLTFEHNGHTARVQESAESHHLRGDGNRWVTDFDLTPILRSPGSRATSALAGNIGTIIGLIALSCPERELPAVLLTDHAWSGTNWHGHQRGPGRTEQPRGVIVTVYFDPENASSTRETLIAIEKDGGALLRALP